MKVYVQWAKRTAEDWKVYDLTDLSGVRALPKKPVPRANDVVDNKEGWFCGLNCQGIDFTGNDHVAIEPITGGLKITGWIDDPDDGPERVAVEWSLYDPAFDPAVGQINTVQRRRIWMNDAMRQQMGVNTPPDALPWEQFVLPPADLTIHGVWLATTDFQRHVNARTLHGWREWIK